MKFAVSEAIDAILLFDTIRYSTDAAFLPEGIWDTLRGVREDPDVLEIPPNDTGAETIAALVSRLAGAGRVAELRLGEIEDALRRAKPIAALAPRYESVSRRSTGSVTVAAVDVLDHMQGFLRLINVIDVSGFSEWWDTDARPRLQGSIDALKQGLSGYDVDHVFFLTRKIRGAEIPEPIWSYCSYCAQKSRFPLSDSEVVHGIGDIGDPRYVLRTTSHELLRGFARPQLVAAYESAVKRDPFLRTLLVGSEWRSRIGPEEMFITAADLYIGYKAGLYALDEAFAFLDGLYGNSLPLSVIILDLLLRSDGLPGSYSDWLVERFRNGTIRVGSIAAQVDEILPGYSESVSKQRSSHDEYLLRLRQAGLR